MDLNTIRQKIVDTSPADWNKITCWGAVSGPVYHYGFSSERGDNGVETEAQGHANIAVLIADVDISIAWGYDPDESLLAGFNRDFDFDFLPKFPDHSVSRIYADVFYRGALVDRELLVVADGGRYYVPIPRTTYPNKKSPRDFSAPEYHYTTWGLGFARVVHGYEHAESFDELLARMNYVVDDDGPGIY